MAYKIFQVSPWIDNSELTYIKRSLKNSWITEGALANEFLDKIKFVTKSKYALLAPNGTLGLYLALKVFDFPKGSEIIIPSFSFYASGSSAVFSNLTPVFVDVSLDDFNIDVQKIEKLISKKTVAIMPVHVYGQSAKNDAIKKIAKKYNLKVIEDAAQAFNVFFKNKHCGTFGDIGVISFFADKTITTGEGSVLLTQSASLYKKLKLLRNQGRPNSGTFIHNSLGMNFRMTDLQCAVGLGQIEKLHKISNKRRSDFNKYLKLLKGVGDLEFLQVKDKKSFVPFRFVIRTKYKRKLIDFLENNRIQTRSFFYPLNKQPKFKKYKNDGCTNAYKLYEEGICLPLHYSLTENDITYITNKVKYFFKNTL